MGGANADSPDRSVTCMIVGGGVHGTHLAVRLLETTALSHEEIAIVDPHPELLAAFREQCRACGMETLRSAYVHHLGMEAFALERFAEDRGRTGELIPTVDYPERPSVDLFFDHADHVIERHRLHRLHHRAKVTDVERRSGDGYRVTTTDGSFAADRCVLAIGHGGHLRRPGWAADLDGATHVWDRGDCPIHAGPGSPSPRSAPGSQPRSEDSDIDPLTAREGRQTIVVGSGITGAQVTRALSEREHVMLLTRSPIEWTIPEAAPPWVTWRHLERELHEYPPGSAERLRPVDEARNDGTIPPWFYQPFRKAMANDRLKFEQGEVTAAIDLSDGVYRRLKHRMRLSQRYPSPRLQTRLLGVRVITLQRIEESASRFITGRMSRPT